MGVAKIRRKIAEHRRIIAGRCGEIGDNSAIILPLFRQAAFFRRIIAERSPATVGDARR